MRNFAHMLYKWTQDVRNILFKPLVLFLDSFGVAPSTLSYAGIVCMIGFVLNIRTSIPTAFGLALAATLCDFVDGPLARHQKRSSDMGKFVDVVCDSVVFSLFVVGLIYGGLLDGTMGALFVYVMALNKVLRIMDLSRHYKTNWKFYPYSGFLPNGFVTAMYLGFLVFFITGWNWFLWIAFWGNIVLALDSIRVFRLIH